MFAGKFVLSILLMGMCLLLVGCPRPGPRPEAPEVTALLAPPDDRPLASVAIADATEIALLEQQLKLVPIRREGQKLIFVANADVIEKLRDLHYTVEPESPYTSYRRVLRIDGAPSPELLSQSGVRLINREESYVIVEGTLASLRLLAASGLRIAPLKADEPRPREIRVTVPSRADVQRVAELHVDIYSVDARERQVTIYGGAFDFQIDALRARGFTVDVMSTVQ